MIAPRISQFADIEWQRHPAYPGPLAENGNRPGRSPEHWRWFGGSAAETPAWIWITNEERAIDAECSLWEHVVKRLSLLKRL